MARVGILKTKTLFSREVQAIGRCVSKIRGLSQARKLKASIDESEKRDDSSSCWLPHPRTGIYFPQGHERVLEDVPDEAASFEQTYWLRSIDGVDKPQPEYSTDFYFDTKQ